MEQPNHIAKETTNGTKFNLDALYRICPSCFTESVDADGNLKHVVDFEKLRALLGDDAVCVFASHFISTTCMLNGRKVIT